MKVVTTYRDKPVCLYGLSFGRWSTCTGALFIRERIYRKGFKWTPFIRYYKRYDTWLGYYEDGNQTGRPVTTS